MKRLIGKLGCVSLRLASVGDTLKSSYASDAGFQYFIGLVMVLSAAAIYARKLHWISRKTEPKQS